MYILVKNSRFRVYVFEILFNNYEFFDNYKKLLFLFEEYLFFS